MSDTVEMLPNDEHNQKLIANVHPPDWTNPKPDGRYNIVAIGGGTAGLVTAAGAAGLGAKAALIEKNMLGGDCLNVGCVPSKALLRVAKAYAEVRGAGDLGIRTGSEPRVDFPAVMERMRRLRAKIAPHDSAQRFRDLGVDVYLGEAKFVGRNKVEVDGRVIEFSKACIATGGRAAAPPIPGLGDIEYLTNETLFELTELPKDLIVIGAGPIGCEMAQSFRRFGSNVTILEMASRILIKEDEDAGEIVRAALVADGIQLELGVKIASLKKRGARVIATLETADGNQTALEADRVLVAAGRKPNVEGLGLEVAGVACTKHGVTVDDRLRTSNPNIFAAGDICSQYQFTHTADALARIVIGNALFPGRGKASALTVPWATYTDPEIAHVGLYPGEAKERGIEIDTYTEDFSHVDRAILDEENGLVKIHVRKGTDKIVGATIVAKHAGDLISEITVAMAAGAGLGTIAKAIHPYPTQAEAIKRLGDAYNRTRLTPFVKSLFEKWFSFTR
ncbi:MAG: mercuric reductase [Gemmatimonadetes bacterium]|nr:mercuric reductase [Gemmatimonadota bacterium]